MSWLIVTVAVLFGLLLLVQVRVGVALEYIAQRFVVKVRFGALSFRVIPSDKKKEIKPQKDTAASGKEKKPMSRFLPFVPCVARAVGRILQKLRVDKLDLNIQVGGQDPADTAVRYGQLNAAVGAVWGPFRQFVNVKDADIHLGVDFDAGKTRAQGVLSVSWRLAQLLSALLLLARDALVIAYNNHSTQKQEGMVT